jgi:hypothetical protein
MSPWVWAVIGGCAAFVFMLCWQAIGLYSQRREAAEKERSAVLAQAVGWKPSVDNHTNLITQHNKRLQDLEEQVEQLYKDREGPQ